MAKRFQIKSIGQFMHSGGPVGGRDFSVKLVGDEGELLLGMHETIAADLFKKLQDLKLPPSGMSPLRKI